jgi:hypothetical protein
MSNTTAGRQLFPCRERPGGRTRRSNTVIAITGAGHLVPQNTADLVTDDDGVVLSTRTRHSPWWRGSTVYELVR